MNAEDIDIPEHLASEDAEYSEAMAADKGERVDVALQSGIGGLPLAYARAEGLSVAEQQVLGSLMDDPSTWDPVSRILIATDFVSPEHQEIYRTIRELAESHQAHDFIAVGLRLQANGRLDAAGGFAYLSRITRDTAAPGNAAMYAEAIRVDSHKRQLKAAGKALLADLESGELDNAHIVETLQARLIPLQADIRAVVPKRLNRKPMDLRARKGSGKKERDWAVDQWLGMGYVTLLAGAGGLGKTLIAQTIANGLAVGKGFPDHAPRARKVLVIAGEDDEDELHNRQIDICAWMGVDYDAAAENMILVSYKGCDIGMAERGANGNLVKTAVLNELREQIGDYGATYVILDSSARVFGGNESDRHEVTKFSTWLEWACEPTAAGLLLLAHPAKAIGSEYSGSTAWEGSVRSRLYLARELPDQKKDKDEEPPEDQEGVRYLCRRKANYSSRDYRKLIWQNGLLVPEAFQQAAPAFATRYGKADRDKNAEDVVLMGVRRLAEIGQHGSRSSQSTADYLPKKLVEMELAQGLKVKELGKAMHRLILARRLIEVQVGIKSNRQPRMGLAEPDASGGNPS